MGWALNGNVFLNSRKTTFKLQDLGELFESGILEAFVEQQLTSSVFVNGNTNFRRTVARGG
jgi:hypothetical protein